MSEQRFTITNKEWICYNGGYAYTVSNGECEFALWEDEEDAQKVCDYLNEQQATITELERKLKKYAKIGEEQLKQIIKLQEENEQLQAQLREKEQDEQLYANEILELREANKEFIQFKELGGDY